MRPALSPLEPLRSAWRRRDLVWQMTERDARSRYRGSAGGLFWVVFHPLLMLGVYTLFFTELFPTRWAIGGDSRSSFALILFIGLLLHGLLAEVLSRAPALITGNANLVKKVVFPLDVLPIVSLGSTLFHFAIGVAIWLVFHAFQRGLPPVTALWLPVIVLPLAVLALGLSWVLASLGRLPARCRARRARRRDDPAVRKPDLLSARLAQGAAAHDRGVQPAHHSRRTGAAVLIGGRAPDFAALALYTLVALAIAYVGFIWFQGTRKGFADVV